LDGLDDLLDGIGDGLAHGKRCLNDLLHHRRRLGGVHDRLDGGNRNRVRHGWGQGQLGATGVTRERDPQQRCRGEDMVGHFWNKI
jgi:hypothetical protein